MCIHTLAPSKEEGEGGARPPPQLLPTTHLPVLKPLNLDSSLYSTSIISQTPAKLHYVYSSPYHRGACAGAAESVHTYTYIHKGLPPGPGAATPPIPPYPWFPQQRWSRLEWARDIGSAAPHPPTPLMLTSRCRWTAAGSHPTLGTHDDLCGFLKLCYNAVWTG